MNISDDLKRIFEDCTKGRYGFLCEYVHRFLKAFP